AAQGIFKMPALLMARSRAAVTVILNALRALRELLYNGDRDDGDELVASYRALGKAIVKNKPMTRKDRSRVAKYLREVGWGEGAIGAATAQAGATGYADLRESG